MTDPNPKLLQLVDRLSYGTEQGYIKWEAVGETSFSYSTADAGITIESVDGDGQLPFAVRVFDGRGTLLESETSHDERGDGLRPRDSAAQLAGLYDVARRNALNIDPVLDALIKQVDNTIRASEPDVPF
jgi:hypothetical protein